MATGDIYTVTFKDYDGTILETQKVEEGKDAKHPNHPTRDGHYLFAGWDGDYKSVMNDLTLTATYIQYTPGEYFTETITLPQHTLATGTWQILGGSKSSSFSLGLEALPSDSVISKLTLSGNYRVSGGTAISVATVYGKTLPELSTTAKEFVIEIEPDPNLTSIDVSITFSGTSSTSRSLILENMQLYIEYSVGSVFAVRFFDVYGTVLSAQLLNGYESATVPPDLPNINGAIFIEWKGGNYSQVTRNLNIIPNYVVPVLNKLFLGSNNQWDMYIGDFELNKAYLGHEIVFNKYYQHEKDYDTFALSISGIFGGDKSLSFSIPSQIQHLPVESIKLYFRMQVRTMSTGRINTRILINETDCRSYYIASDNNPDFGYGKVMVDEEVEWDFGTTAPSTIKFSIAMNTGGMDLENQTQVIFSNVRVVTKFAQALSIIEL